jgi:hypothetical protein
VVEVRRGHWQRNWQRYWIALGVLVATLLCVGVLVRLGTVTGLEFSPREFRFRQFRYVEFPLLRLQITRITRGVASHHDVDFLRNDGYVSSNPELHSQNWDLATVDRWNSSAHGDASFLYRALEAGGSESPWRKWTADHGELAWELWPEVQRLAELRLYELIPSFLEFAASAAPDESLVWKIADYLAEQLVTRAEVLEKLDQRAQAAELFDEALRHLADDDPRTQQIRSRRASTTDSAPAT